MLKLKTKWFNKWAKKNKVLDSELINTLENLTNNLGVVNLGRGLFKIRTPKYGKGKRGGYRTIMVFREAEIAIFVYGFAKNEKDNIDKEELKYFKKLAKDLLEITQSKYKKMIKDGAFISLRNTK